MRNLGQSHCRWCTEAYYACQINGCLSEETKDELFKFKDQNGHYWRKKLRDLWMQGSEVLREVRNRVGPTDLAKVKPVRRMTNILDK